MSNLTIARDKFKAGLEALNFMVELKDEDKIIVPVVVAEGRFANQHIRLGLQIPQDFEMNPPGGIHISPRIVPINTGAQDHTRVAESTPFGAEWVYLSRPFKGQWALKRTVKRYMEFVADLLNTL